MADERGQGEPETKVTKAAAAARNIVSAEEFITSSPLFVVTPVENFYPPEQISFDCPGLCSKETTWFRNYEPRTLDEPNTTDIKIASVGYTCMRCKICTLSVVYRKQTYEDRMVRIKPGVTGMGVRGSSGPPAATEKSVPVLVGIMKIGQYPPPSVKLPKGLEKGLGIDGAELYRKALISRNNGYGLAAAVYIRRVVEDKTNELIEVAAQLAESHNVDPIVVKQIRQIGDPSDYTPYERKLEVAATVFPDSLKAGSVNPLKALYTLVSKAIHGLSEPECIDVADRTKEVFEYIFTNLRAQVADQRIFLEKMKGLS